MSKITTNLGDDDFGFSFVNEDELRQIERQLETKLEDTSKAAESTNEKLQSMYNMVLPLLKNLMKNPEKEYIYWPDRSSKIASFIKKLEKFTEQ